MVYMDYNATTPCDKRVVESMLPYFSENFANASSVYQPARAARKAVEEAREKVASLAGCLPEEIFFTSGGTESDNWAIVGAALKLEASGKHIITSRVEHHAVINTCKALARKGYRITYLPVDSHGVVDLSKLEASIKKDTVLVSVMYANNEIGTIQPVGKIAELARSRGVLFHTDAVQAFGKLPLRLDKNGPDMASFSAHKLYGPKGVGALYIRKGVSIPPFINGGGQEKGRRSGTTNVAGIVGFGRAAEIVAAEMDADIERVGNLRDILEKRIMETIPEIVVNGHPENRLHNTLNVCIRYIEGESILMSLDFEGICASSGSACTSGSLEPSHVLLAIGLPHEVAHGSLRLSLGRYNTMEDVEKVSSVLPGIVDRLRQISPFWNEKKIG